MSKINQMVSATVCVGLLVTLTACAKEQIYRGVPAKVWKQLNTEQQLLIIDKQLNDELYHKPVEAAS